jgi:hypothetical protein
MCPLCVATMTAWILAGGAGSTAAFTATQLYRKRRAKKLMAKEAKLN